MPNDLVVQEDYPTVAEVQRRRERVKIHIVVGKVVRDEIKVKLESYGGTLSALGRHLLEKWNKEHPFPDAAE